MQAEFSVGTAGGPPVAKAGEGRLLRFAAILVALAAVLPIAAILWIALSGSFSAWPHLIENVIPRSAATTATLLLQVCASTLVTGVATAWLTSTCEFPLRRTLTVMLVLPLAMPAYLSAYAFGEFFDYSGPLQSAIRALTGLRSARDYWAPDIRTTTGASFVLGSVLYPYVFLTARTMFLMQGRNAAEVARTLGAVPLRTFFRVQLPMARPAIVVGLTLVIMETLNDIGAVEYLGVKTLTFSIYETWLNRNDLAGAAQIALVMLALVILLAFIERHARGRQRFAGSKPVSAQNVARISLSGPWRALAVLVCALPPLVGFFIPAWVMAGYAVKRLGAFASPTLLSALGHTVLVAAGAAVVASLAGFVLAYSVRHGGTRVVRAANRFAAFGYGVPGTVLAIGVLIPLAAFDNALSAATRSAFGISAGLLLSGTGFAIVYASAVRFLTMAEGNIAAGFDKLSPNLDWAARTLGRTRGQALREVLMPMMRPATLTAALLVFIETSKELSATILLRPFNFNTLATLVYEDASRSQVAAASVPSVIIILAGLVPVIVVSRLLDRGR
ncbi:MAG TPA: iron ABC transporter permease [Ensifer sp.]|nr:iron ABC transporter permease [Ensifer sp.]